MSNINSTTSGASRSFRFVLLGALVLLAFFASYRFALAARGDASPAGGAVFAAAPGSGGCAMMSGGSGTAPGGAGGTGGAGGCCGGSGSSTPIEGAATADADGVQRITVDTSTGSYEPNVIKLAAGVPAEITFKQAGGCLAQVMSKDLGFFEDISTGDKTIKLEGLSAGTYEFSCGMQMVFGQIVVE